MVTGQDAEDRVALIPINHLRVSTLALFPVEVDTKSVSGNTSHTITSQIVSAYKENTAGHFVKAASEFVRHHFNILALISSYFIATTCKSGVYLGCES